MKKIQFKTSVYCLSFLAISIDHYFLQEHTQSVFFKASLYRAWKELSKRVSNIEIGGNGSKKVKKKEYQITLNYDEFLAVFEFMKIFKMWEESAEMQVLFGEIDEINVNAIHTLNI